ncbi:uncharacterized protein LOC144859373 isoform X2 [Branchiostoma floridae x Branchiostoma japonicum]
MSLKTLYCVSMVLCVLGSVVSVYSTAGQSGSPSQRLKRKHIRSLSENCPFECDCNPGTLQCSQSVTRGSLAEVPDRLGSFTKARQSKTLNFEGNSITRISDDDFFGLSQAKTLNLRHNQLTAVAPDAFEGLGSLRQLFLDYNKIGDLPVDIFDPLVNLRVLDLSHNELTLDDPEDTPFLTSHGLQHIQTLDLSHNELTLDDPEDTPFLTSHGLQHIQTLNLSNNAIQALWDSTLMGLEQLTTLILDDNPLQDVQRNVFAGLPSLQELSLVNVGLQPEVLLRELPNLPNLKRIHLGNGRDPCDCAWAKLKARLKKGGVVIVDQDAVSECGEGGLRVCVDTESKNAVRKDDTPNNNKAVKLSWKSVSYGPPSEKHSSAQIPPLEKGFNGYKPKKTTPSQLKDRLLHTEGKERVRGTDTLPWRHPGRMKALAQDRLYSKESVSSGTDALSWWNPGKMKAPAQVASEKSPASFPWWQPDYVRTPTVQGFGMMKSPMSENEVDKEQSSSNVQNNPSQNDVDKKLQHYNNIRNILTEIKKTSNTLGGRKMLNYMGNGRKAGRHGSRKKGEQTDEMSQREHGRRGGNEWLYDLWKRKASEKAASETESALDDIQYLIKEEEENFERLREKVKKLRTKIHHMKE